MFDNNFDPYAQLVSNSDSITQLALAYNQMQAIVADLTQQHNQLVHHVKVMKNQVYQLNNQVARLNEQLDELRH